jgi:hypothetical protein
VSMWFSALGLQRSTYIMKGHNGDIFANIELSH